MSFMLKGKIIELSTTQQIKPIRPFEEIYAKILGDDGQIYLIIGMFDYMNIDKSLRSPVDKGFIDYQTVGRRVNFDFFEWNEFKIINRVFVDLADV
jgi:hypothetical protein